MTSTKEITDEISQEMTRALLKLHKLTERDQSDEVDFTKVVKVFLLGVISTAIDLAELDLPGSALLIYADIEAAAKEGGLRKIKKMQDETGSLHYSVSNVDEDDPATAMNYLGQQLSTTLYKSLHELPLPLRKPEMLLRAVEALLTNLLDQKFDDSHEILDSFCEHVHMALDDLQSRKY